MLFPDSGYFVSSNTNLSLVGSKVAEYPWGSVLVSEQAWEAHSPPPEVRVPYATT